MSYADPNFDRNPNVHAMPDEQPLVWPHLLQDCDKGLTAWFSGKPGALRHAIEAAREIARKTASQDEA